MKKKAERQEIVRLLRSPGVRKLLRQDQWNKKVCGDGLRNKRPMSQARTDAVLKASLNALKGELCG